MTPQELELCFKMLRAYFPGDWTDERYLAWAEAFEGFEYSYVRDAIVAMGRTERFATVAAFLELIGATKPAGVIREAGRTFLPGTGWVDDWSEPRELEAVATVTDLSELRRQLTREVGS